MRSLLQTLRQQAQIGIGPRLFELFGRREPEPLGMHQKPASAQENQALQRHAPLDGQSQENQEGKLGRITAQAVIQGLDAVAHLVDFLRKEADDLRPLRIGQVARPQPQCLAVKRPPQAGGRFKHDARADRFRAPQARAAQRGNQDAD